MSPPATERCASPDEGDPSEPSLLALVGPDGRVRRLGRAAAGRTGDDPRPFAWVEPDDEARLHALVAGARGEGAAAGRIRLRGDLHAVQVLAVDVGEVDGPGDVLLVARTCPFGAAGTDLLEVAFRHAPDTVILTDATGRIVYVNPAFEASTGVGAADAVGKHPRQMAGGTFPSEMAALHRAAMRALEAHRGEFVRVGPDGLPVHEEAVVAPVRDADGQVTHWLYTARDLTDLRALQRSLEASSRVDALTGLPNRQALAQHGEALIRGAALAGSSLAVLYLDLDRLKAVNDTLGHANGDRVLAEVARRFRAAVRPGDLLARQGGDEFVAILESAGPACAAEVADRLRAALDVPIRVAGQAVYAHVSIGVAVYPRDGASFEEVLQSADMAMFHAKRHSLGRAAYEPTFGRRTRDRVQLEDEIHTALEHDQLTLHYQPVLDLVDGSVRHAEALMRWRHPIRGLVPPGDFIPVAEDTGNIRQLDRWALRTAARQARRWADRGLPISVAVNLSARSFSDPGLPAWIDATLAEEGVKPGQLSVEITESTAMGHAQETIARVGELSSRGIVVALDDFGTGYSSLAYLKHFHVDVLKVDRTFVAGIGREPRDERLIEVMALLARGLGVRMVAEGVETLEQLAWLQERGCHLAQGYWIARPMPADDLETWLRARLPTT